MGSVFKIVLQSEPADASAVNGGFVNEKPFPLPGQTWRFIGKDIYPPMAPHEIASLQWLCDEVIANFVGGGCASIRWMVTLPEWEFVADVAECTHPNDKRVLVPNDDGDVAAGGVVACALCKETLIEPSVKTWRKWQRSSPMGVMPRMLFKMTPGQANAFVHRFNTANLSLSADDLEKLQKVARDP